MSGNASTPWIINSRPELSYEKYAEIAGANSQEELKSKMLAMEFDELRQLEVLILLRIIFHFCFISEI